jgi:CheY-like chemotaxis protein
MITAEKDLNWLSKSFSAGATLFLAKPFTPDQLQKTLQLLLTAASIESRSAA